MSRKTINKRNEKILITPTRKKIQPITPSIESQLHNCYYLINFFYLLPSK